MSNLIILFLIVASLCAQWTLGFRVLIFLPGTTKMERQHFEHLAQYLAHANHKVATAKAILIPQPKTLITHRLHEVRELVLDTELDKDTLNRLTNVWDKIWTADSYEEATEMSESILNRANVHACDSLLNSDLLDRINEGSYEVALIYKGQPCHMALAHAAGVPWIYFDHTGFSDELHTASGYSWPAGHIPSTGLQLTQPMTFVERIKNSVSWMREYAAASGFSIFGRLLSSRYRELDYPISTLFQNDYELRKLHPHFPSIEELKANAAAYFVNWDAELEFGGRQISHNVHYVGGYHMEPAKPMFENWNDSVHSAPDGLIIVSFGVQVTLSSMPKKSLESLFEALGMLKTYRVFVYTDKMELDVHVPSNVNVTRFLPQRDLFATSRVKLLISNGGPHSLMEAVLHGTPVLAVPLKGTDFSNAAKLRRHRLAYLLNKDKFLNEGSGGIYAAIMNVLDDPRFSLSARRFAKRHTQRPSDGFDAMLRVMHCVAEGKKSMGVRLSEADGERIKAPLWVCCGLDVLALITFGPILLFKLCTLVLMLRKRSQQFLTSNDKQQQAESCAETKKKI